VPSFGGNSEVGVQVTDTDAQDAASHQSHNQNIKENRVPEIGESSNNVAISVTSDPPKSSEGTPPTTSSGTQQKAETQKTDTQSSKKKPADPNDQFEPWERELMEELLNDVKGHLGKQPYRGYRLGSRNHSSPLPYAFLGRRRCCE
jgi:hypothetical protein